MENNKTRNTKSKVKGFCLWLVFVLICASIGSAIGIAILTPILNYMHEQEMAKLIETIDESRKQQAIEQLYQLRGRVKEIEYISWSYASNTPEMEDKLLSHLEDIATNQKFINEFLSDFKMSITASEIGDICEELISQIDEKIRTLRYGTGDT